MVSRVVIPELLDHLPAADTQAMRSRRDLRRINFLMGNERWVCRTLRKFPAAAARGIVETGAQRVPGTQNQPTLFEKPQRP